MSTLAKVTSTVPLEVAYKTAPGSPVPVARVAQAVTSVAVDDDVLVDVIDGHLVLRDVLGTDLGDSSAASALIREGGQATAASTSATAATDVITASGLSIAQDRWMRILVSWRKTGTASTVKSFGLKLNSTVFDVVVVSGVISSTATNGGYVEFFVPPYLAAHAGFNNATMKAAGARGQTEVIERALVAAERPNATIASVTVRGAVTNAADTLYFGALNIYSGATS